MTAFLRPAAASRGHDHLHACLCHPKHLKPHDEPVDKWNARTDALMNAAVELEGTEPALDADGLKKAKFESYDPDWRTQFALAKNCDAAPVGEMIQWFKDKKMDADKKEKKRKWQTHQRRGHGCQSRGRGGRGRHYAGGGRSFGIFNPNYYPSQHGAPGGFAG